MIRLFNHYLHRVTVQRVVQDLLLVVLGIGGFLLMLQVPQRAELDRAFIPAASMGLGLFLINGVSGFYDRDFSLPLSQTFARAVLAIAAAVTMAWLVSEWMPMDLITESTYRAVVAASAGAVVGVRVISTYLSSRERAAASRVLVFGAGPAAMEAMNTLRASDPQCAVAGFIRGPNEAETVVPAGMVVEHGGELIDLVRQLEIDEIIVALTERRGGSMPLRQLLDCKLQGVRVWDLNTHFERRLGQLRLDYVKAGWLIFTDGFDQSAWRMAIKRAFDVGSALLLMVPGLPLIALGALAVRLESRGPAFYRQERVGQHGRPFEVVKLRSMYSDAEKDGKPRWATTNDSRITRVGRFIRKTRIDELPQLFNVLRGEMSMVGPRPERAYFVEQLIAQLPYFAVRQSVKPGITGWAQVRCDYGSSLEETKAKLQYDLYYVKNHSWFLDIVVMLETVAVVLTGRGAR